MVSATRCCLILGVEPQSTSVYPKTKIDVTILDKEKKSREQGGGPRKLERQGKTKSQNFFLTEQRKGVINSPGLQDEK